MNKILLTPICSYCTIDNNIPTHRNIQSQLSLLHILSILIVGNKFIDERIIIPALRCPLLWRCSGSNRYLYCRYDGDRTAMQTSKVLHGDLGQRSLVKPETKLPSKRITFSNVRVMNIRNVYKRRYYVS